MGVAQTWCFLIQNYELLDSGYERWWELHWLRFKLCWKSLFLALSKYPIVSTDDDEDEDSSDDEDGEKNGQNKVGLPKQVSERG